MHHSPSRCPMRGSCTRVGSRKWSLIVTPVSYVYASPNRTYLHISNPNCKYSRLDWKFSIYIVILRHFHTTYNHSRLVGVSILNACSIVLAPSFSSHSASLSSSWTSNKLKHESYTIQVFAWHVRGSTSHRRRSTKQKFNRRWNRLKRKREISEGKASRCPCS